MKEHNEIDQLFEQQLGNLSVEPSATSWEHITSSLDTGAASGVAATSYKKFYLYALIGTVAAILAYVLLFNQGKGREITPSAHPVVELKTPQENISKGSDQKTDVSIGRKEQVVKEPQASVVYNLPEEDNITTDRQMNLPGSQNVVDKDVIKHEISLSEHKASKEAKAKNKTKKAVVNTPVVYSTAVFTESSSEVAQVSEVASKKEIITILAEKKQNTEKVNEQSETPLATEEVTKEEVLGNNESTEKVEGSSQEEETIETEVQQKSEEQNEPLRAVGIDDIVQTEEVSDASSTEAVTGLHHATGWSLDAYIGPANIQSNEKLAPTNGESIYQTGKDKKITTPNMGINIKFHFDNWFIQSGISYAEYGENKDYIQQFEMHDTSGFSKQAIDDYYTYDTTGWILDPNNSGVLIPVFDAVHHSDTSYNWITEDSLYYEHQAIYAQNRFRYIEIPAMVGYEFRFKNLGVELATGVSVGFRVNSSGKFLDSDNNLIDINPSNSPYTNTMMNYILTVGVKYHLSNRFSIIAQPIYKTNLNSIIETGVGSSTRYSSFGVNIGMNYIIK